MLHVCTLFHVRSFVPSVCYNPLENVSHATASAPCVRPPPQAHRTDLRRGVLVSMLTLFTALLGAKTSLLEMGVQANQRYWQHLTSSNLEQLLQVCAACL